MLPSAARHGWISPGGSAPHSSRLTGDNDNQWTCSLWEHIHFVNAVLVTSCLSSQKKEWTMKALQVVWIPGKPHTSAVSIHLYKVTAYFEDLQRRLWQSPFAQSTNSQPASVLRVGWDSSECGDLCDTNFSWLSVLRGKYVNMVAEHDGAELNCTWRGSISQF